MADSESLPPAGGLLRQMLAQGFEQVLFSTDAATGLAAVIVIHDTTLGPAFGGTRMMPYASEEQAVRDALKLARAMTYKNAAAGLDFGGGKAVIIGDAATGKTEALLRSFGRAVDSLGGRFIAGVDIGTVEDDMVYLKKETRHVTALPLAYGGAGSTSEATAFGTYTGIRAAAQVLFGAAGLGGLTIAIQGVGHVGAGLARRLAGEEARLLLADVDRARVEAVAAETGARVVDPAAIHAVDCDVYSPCALGGVLNDRTIPELRCRLVAGAANNQFAQETTHDRMLRERGIAFVPDFILSAGGVINNSHQYTGYSRDRAYAHIERVIDANVRRIVSLCRDGGAELPTRAAMRLAEERIQAVRAMKRLRMA